MKSYKKSLINYRLFNLIILLHFILEVPTSWGKNSAIIINNPFAVFAFISQFSWSNYVVKSMLSSRKNGFQLDEFVDVLPSYTGIGEKPVYYGMTLHFWLLKFINFTHNVNSLFKIFFEKMVNKFLDFTFLMFKN